MNDFQVISKIGEGAYSTVLMVKRIVDGNIYALKRVKLLNLSDKEKQNALNEVRILASVKSKHVISYKECFFEENETCLGIVMEYADNGDLYQKICETKKAKVMFDESEIWRIFIQMVKGLKALHDLKILHRDLKSANVFLFKDGTTKLGDLNVSKVAKRGLGYTQTGTPYYASPEVWRDQPYDLKSDIWSLGCVLYEIVTLKPPFRAENMEGLYNKVIKGQFSKINEKYSNDLWEILVLLIQVHPENRPNCEQILKNNIVAKRIKLVNEMKSEESIEESSLLQTIKIPKNLLFLTDKLPKSNYEKDMSQIIKNQSFSNKQDLINKSKNRSGNASDDDGRKKKIKITENNKKGNSNEISFDLGSINVSSSNKNKNKPQINKNMVYQDLVVLPKIKNEAPLNLVVRNERENYNYHPKQDNKRKIQNNSKNYLSSNEKRILQLLNNSENYKVNIQYEIHNKQNALINKYYKYKNDKSISPRRDSGRHRYQENMKSLRLENSMSNPKLPIIHDRKLNKYI